MTSIIKCIGCYELRQEEISCSEELMKDFRKNDRGTLVTYTCLNHYFPYATVISGLLYPGKGIRNAVEQCPLRPRESCVICQSPGIAHLGGFESDDCLAAVCKDHYHAWGDWLDEHDALRRKIDPRGRNRTSSWIEVFREFIEYIRQKSGGTP